MTEFLPTESLTDVNFSTHHNTTKFPWKLCTVLNVISIVVINCISIDGINLEKELQKNNWYFVVISFCQSSIAVGIELFGLVFLLLMCL